MMKNTALHMFCSLSIVLLWPSLTRSQSLQWDTVLYRQANEYRTQGDYPKALIAFRECFNRASADKDSLHMGNSLIGIGIVYDEQGSLDTALRYYFEALTVYRHIDNRVKTGGTLKNIGNVYRVLKHYEKAADYLQQALSIQKAQRDSIRIGNVLNDIGLVYMDQDSTTIARQYFEQVIRQYGNAVNKEIKAYVYNNLGIIAANEKKYTQAQSYYHSGLILMHELGKKYGIALILDNMGDAWYDAGDYRQALNYYNQSHELARSINTNELLRSVYDDYAKLYSKTGDYRKAYDYLGLSSKLKDTVYQEESRKAYAEMNARYETEKKQTRIQLLERDSKITNVELLAQRRAKYFFLITSALILLLAILAYRSFLARKKANQQLNLLNKQLTEANSSKTKVLSIISHDLRSPVSSLFHFLQLKKVRKGQQDPKEQEAFDQKISQSAENLLETMEDLLIWSKSQMEQFEPVMENLEVEEIFDDIIQLNSQAAANKQVRLLKDQMPFLEIHTDPNFVRIILRNLVSNAIKFTPPHGTVKLSASLENNLILLHVSDSGPGISPADINNIFEWNSIRSDSSGLGLKLVREFTERLSGQLTIVSDNGKGTKFTVQLPVKQLPVSTATVK